MNILVFFKHYCRVDKSEGGTISYFIDPTIEFDKIFWGTQTMLSYPVSFIAVIEKKYDPSSTWIKVV